MVDSMRRNLPNALTLLRLLIAAAFFATMSVSVVRGAGFEASRQLWGNIAVALFIVGAVTDALDGYLARRWGVVSDFGRIMDPFCDKVLILGTFAYLASPRFAVIDATGQVVGMETRVWAWMVVVIISRELLVTSIRAVIESRGIPFGADWWGKSKMILQAITAPYSLFVAVNPWFSGSTFFGGLQAILVWATVVITAISVIPYLVRGRRLLEAEPAGKE
ncbi:MAG: CDP-diacylglycerol--glycerol-3-phosphate 3-phosphatidyltransferase [Planctomycetes bacterium TMED75]|nr:CDP-diacylglycerol--glycerol-3-phosphate 3-phosphatidyltransferase [Planctomycetaceae bacterium]OUU91454.1 MAG: CDP-diacylglycerol--glycerol-3-phosphate 3-phosphatidyltransferase [Planctomycetes bacterium TMED75]